MTYFQDNNTALLPNGLVDLLPPQAEAEVRAINSFMASFADFGYERVKPPLVEFEESLLHGTGQALARKTFRLMDPVSQRMMGVRADVTAQIARIVTSRLAGEAHPLRLSYAADVLRVNATQLRPQRQFCQVGCELVGENTVLADIEMPLIALKALAGAAIGGLCVDLTVPTLIGHIYDIYGTGADRRALFDRLIEKRDADALTQQEDGAAQALAALMAAAGLWDGAEATLKALGLKGAAGEDINRLIDVAQGLREALDVYGLNDVRITIDPLEQRGFEYQTGVSFTLFAHAARGELGRGGRYDIGSENGAPLTATGFTLYMDSILPVLVVEEPVSLQEVDVAAKGWGALKAVQDKGLVAKRRR